MLYTGCMMLIENSVFSGYDKRESFENPVSRNQHPVQFCFLLKKKAILKADIFIGQAKRVETIDLKALALCGLAVCNHDMINADRAKVSFIHARAITRAKGHVDEVLKFFDLIAELDDKNLLFGLREVAAGTKKI